MKIAASLIGLFGQIQGFDIPRVGGVFHGYQCKL